jgi:hemolysin activation/secretion protein
VRGYPESPAAGDHGYNASLEYRLPFYLLTDSKGAKLPWMAGFFVDWAHTRLNSPLAYESNQNLLGAGLGIYLTMPWGLYFHADFAKPLREVKSAGLPLEGTKSSDYRVHANMGWNF